MSYVGRQSESPFVTFLGWLTAVASGVALLVVLVQVGLLVFRLGPIMMVLPGTIGAIMIPTVGLVSGVGLLKRRNWARNCMVIILSCAIILTIAAYVFVGTESETTIRFGAAENSALVFQPRSTIFSVIGLLFYGLCIYVLSRSDIKKEFGA